MTLITNFEYSGPSMPTKTVCPPELNEHISVRRLTATADDSSVITAGIPLYLAGTTNANDMKVCGDEYGDVAAEGKIYVCEIVEHDPNFATTTDQPEYPNRMPNTSVTLSTYAHTANQPIIVIPLEIGMRVWMIIAHDASGGVTKDTIYNVSASTGYIGALDDPTPDAVTVQVHGFRAVATVATANWALFEYIGFYPLDTA